MNSTLLDLTILFKLGSWTSTKLKPTIGCWRAILFSNPLTGAAGKIVPETSVPRESLRLVQALRSVLRTYTLENRIDAITFLFYRAISERRYCRIEVSLSISIARQSVVACAGYRGSLGKTLSSHSLGLMDELDFNGQLIIDRPLMRRRGGDYEVSRIDLRFSFDYHYRIRRDQYWIPPGPYQADYRSGCERPPGGLIIDRSLSPGVYLATTPSAPRWDRGDGNVALLMLSRQ